ncbi:tRNA nucleotidyltransferase [Desulfovibrio mangrovi]|uniref:tRNA nucleotidyltransferase n=1 Tax=Desulfovibrio mangrovi TaxID=2976983 RepID=UPI002247CB71|nr:tRNA nucleotidyltransferase [Desulfovibrio mangrovi]UZP68259.1 tRNA nucleotidyltransferase [Desulfovibrio mangrovi]
MHTTGMEEYLVGGAVRDILLGRTPHEYDYAFADTVEGFICRNPSARKAGNDFSICILHGLEHAPLRGKSIHEDLLLRDFTINALALDPNGKLYAHPQAFADMRNRTLRATNPTALQDDPIRVFRAARFAADLPEFTIHPDLLQQMRDIGSSGILDQMTPERVAGELFKALHTSMPGTFIRVLQEANCLSPWFKELQGAADVPAGPLPYHRESVLVHTAQVMDQCAGDPTAVYMALCHDLGKTKTPAEVLPHHYKHEHRGEEEAWALGTRLKLSNRLMRAGMVAARQHMKCGAYPSLKAGTRVDLLMEINKHSLLESFCRLIKADCGVDHSDTMSKDREVILNVVLPDELRNKGPESGIRLREMRCVALSRIRR